MKKIKKLLCMLVAVVMVLGLTTTAFAAETTTGTITINDAVPGQTYSVYQILDLESYNKESGAYAYKAAAGWADFLAKEKDCINVDSQGYVTWIADATNDSAVIVAFAKRAKEYAINNADKITDPITQTAPAAAEGEAYSSVTFTGLDLGYYLVDTTLGTLCSLDTTNPNVVMEEKNEVPTSKKEVEEDSKVETDNAWGEVNDADIDQVVNYKATIEVKAGAENYVLHDTMSEGLTYKEDAKVYIDEVAVDPSNYTVSTPGACGCTFEVKFDNEYIASVVGKTIIVTYSATLNENAIIADEGNINNVNLEYGDENDSSFTPVDTTTTYSWEMDILKYTKKDGAETPLAGAIFTLYRDEECKSEIKFTDVTSEEEGAVPTYRVDAEGEVTQITTDNNGRFQLEGLDSDTYYLKEIKAPDGYNKLAGMITVVIGSDGKVSVDGTTVDVVKVENNSGAELPSTGGMGTTVFYILGGILVLAAVVLLVTKRRMSAE